MENYLSIFDILPLEIIIHMLDQIEDDKMFGRLSQVCKKFSILVEEIWKK